MWDSPTYAPGKPLYLAEMVGSLRNKPNGFPPWARVRHQRDFDRVWREGRRARGSQLVVIAVENQMGITRLGLSVGKKVWPGAVQRNHVKRIMREGFRLSYDQLPKGVDLVLIAAKPKLRPQLASLQEELVHLSHKAHRRYREAQVAALPVNSLPTSTKTQGESC